MNRAELKGQAKDLINGHFKFYLVLLLPFYILQIATGVAQTVADIRNVNVVHWAWIISFASSLIMVGVTFVMIDLARGVGDYDAPVSKSFTIANSGDYFIGTIGLMIVTGILTFLWSLLLIVPGIIKSFSYSQAIYIYRDYLDQRHKISFMDAITKSREMMDGHKAEYFVLSLSFILWFLSCVVVLPIFWVQPYYQQTMANYYVKLAAGQREDTDDPVTVVGEEASLNDDVNSDSVDDSSTSNSNAEKPSTTQPENQTPTDDSDESSDNK